MSSAMILSQSQNLTLVTPYALLYSSRGGSVQHQHVYITQDEITVQFTNDDCVKFAVELLEIVCLQVHLEVHGRVGGPGYQVILEY